METSFIITYLYGLRCVPSLAFGISVFTVGIHPHASFILAWSVVAMGANHLHLMAQISTSSHGPLRLSYRPIHAVYFLLLISSRLRRWRTLPKKEAICYYRVHSYPQFSNITEGVYEPSSFYYSRYYTPSQSVKKNIFFLKLS